MMFNVTIGVCHVVHINYLSSATGIPKIRKCSFILTSRTLESHIVDDLHHICRVRDMLQYVYAHVDS